MDWGTIKPTLISLCTDLLINRDVAPDWTAQWKERRGPMFINPEMGALYLKITSCVDIGVDEQRLEMQDFKDNDGNPASNLFDIACGHRRLALQIEAWAPEDSDTVSAINMLETLRTRLWWQRATDVLLAVNMVIPEFSPAVEQTRTLDKRRYSVAVMTAQVVVAFNEIDPIPVGWIERIIHTSHVQVGGSDLPSPPNVTNELLPPEE